MRSERFDVEPGDWYLNTDLDELVAVLRLEWWGFPGHCSSTKTASE